jgi:hypothetical protein
MAGATRSHVRKEAIKQPSSRSDDGDDTHTPLGDSTNLGARNNTYNTSQDSDYLSSRNDVSRLSEGLEPLHLVGEDGE